MTQEKQLLLEDLCARLPHKQKVCYKIHTSSEEITATLSGALLDYFKTEEIKVVRPFLRPMSSMTMDEEKEYFSFYFFEKNCFNNTIGAYKLLDWLNAHHFDYRGLIKKGLALEAPEGIYNTKTE